MWTGDIVGNNSGEIYLSNVRTGQVCSCRLHVFIEVSCVRPVNS